MWDQPKDDRPCTQYVGKLHLPLGPRMHSCRKYHSYLSTNVWCSEKCTAVNFSMHLTYSVAKQYLYSCHRGTIPHCTYSCSRRLRAPCMAPEGGWDCGRRRHAQLAPSICRPIHKVMKFISHIGTHMVVQNHAHAAAQLQTNDSVVLQTP